MYAIIKKYCLTAGLLGIGCTIFLWLMLYEPLPITYSSTAIILLLAALILRYGAISVPSAIITCAFFPSLALFWAHLHNRTLISGLEAVLQTNQLWGETAVHLSLVSLVFALALLSTFNSKSISSFELAPKQYYFTEKPYIFFSLASVFFFWLAEPSFTTILTTPYKEILSARYDGTQYAGAVGILFWLFSLTTYMAKIGREKPTTLNLWSDRLFIIATTIIVLWLLLHSRRNELMGIGIALTFYILHQRGKLLASLFGVIFLALLLSVGFIRGASLATNITQSKQTQLIKQAIKKHPTLRYQQHRQIAKRELRRTKKVKPLPSGASNIFLTYLTTIHYFDRHPFLQGQTFTNYLFSLLPTNLSNYLNLKKPEYFYQQILKKYDYNGGTYIGAVFYGNFGVFGAVVFGLFVGFYILLVTKLLKSSNIILQIIGFYMLGMVFRGFWYELITIIKPVIIVLLPTYLFIALTHKYSSKLPSQKLFNLIKFRS